MYMYCVYTNTYFLSATWLHHSQLWATVDGAAPYIYVMYIYMHMHVFMYICVVYFFFKACVRYF